MEKQKLGQFLQNKGVQKLNLAKNVDRKIYSSNPIFLQKNIFRKIPNENREVVHQTCFAVDNFC
jgi:hypothetical protein